MNQTNVKLIPRSLFKYSHNSTLFAQNGTKIGAITNPKQLQTQLMFLGYNVGSTGADGKWGRNSQAALDKALAEGYVLKNGTLTPPPGKSLIKRSFFPEAEKMYAEADAAKKAKTIEQNSFMGAPYRADYTAADHAKANAKSMQEQLIKAGYNVGRTGADGMWGKNSQAALDKALAEGYTVRGGKLVTANPKAQAKPAAATTNTEEPKPALVPKAQPIKIATPEKPGLFAQIKNVVSSPIYDNVYPYNYGDVETEDGKTRQIKGSDSASAQLKAGIGKFTDAISGMDPRRDLMNKMAALDLNTEEGLNQWKALAQKADGLDTKMVRYNGKTLQQIQNQQWEMRARLDAMNLYQGRKQQWNTFAEQSDASKKSGRATKAGKPTLIIADQNQRNRINGEMLNYWNAHPELRIKGEDGTVKMPFMSYLGNATIVQQSDGSLRYTDDWDYTWSSDSDPNRPYFGEVLSDFSGKGYGVGVNGRSFHEGMDNLASNLKQEAIAHNKNQHWIQNVFELWS